MALSIGTALAQAMGVAAASDLGAAATIELRTGSKPAAVDDAATGTLLGTVSVTGSFTSTDAVLTAADPAAVAVVASGTAGYFRAKTSGGTAKIDGTITESGGGGDMILDDVDLVSGGTVNLGVPSFTMPLA